MKGFRVYGITEPGPVRPANEDHILLGRFLKGRGGLGLSFAEDDDFVAAFGVLFAVADGVGGNHGGGIASKLALSACDAQFYSGEKGPEAAKSCAEAIQAAGERANRTILDVAATRPELADMGCTLAGVCLTQSGCHVFHAGDSRAYRLRNGCLKQLTSDDTVVEAAVQAGHLSVAEAAQSPMRHTITNSLGSRTFLLHIEPGPDLKERDALLICTDGLHDLLTHEEIESTMAASQSPEDAARALVDKAVQAGGTDNISVIVIGF